MKKIILLFIAIVISSVAFSQTAYEKKCSQIFMKYWKIFAFNQPMSKADEIAMREMVGVYEKAKDYLKIAALNYYMTTGKDPNPLMNQMEKEYTAARSLMTPREKADYRVEEERKSNFGKVKWDAVLKFVKWHPKGEYEKTSEYEAWLRDSARIVFDEIMYKEIFSFVDNNGWHFDFGNYNADKESLNVIFEDKIEKNSLTHTIKCNPELAKKLRDYIDAETRIKYDESSLLTDGQDFCPTKFTIVSQYGEWTFDNKKILPSLQEVTVQYDKLRLQDFSSGYALLDKYMKGHVFNYNKYVSSAQQRQAVKDSLARREQEIRDSIAVIEKERQDSIDYVVYSNMLDSLVNDINTHLIKEKYNLFGFQIVNHEVIDKKNPMISYQAAVTKLQTERSEQKKQLQSVHDEIFNQNKDIFGSTETFDKYYCQGLDVFMDSLVSIVNNKLATNKYNVNQYRIESHRALDNHNDTQSFLTWATEITTERKRIGDQIMRERSKIWSQNKDVFNENTNEFDKYYCQGMEYFNANIEYLRILKYLEDNTNRIAAIDFKKHKFDSALTGEYDTKKNIEDINSFGVNVVNMVYTCKGSSYYAKIINILMTNNLSLSAEYEKKGDKFSSEVDFYEAFISDKYKDILKSKKK